MTRATHIADMELPALTETPTESVGNGMFDPFVHLPLSLIVNLPSHVLLATSALLAVALST